MKTRHARRLLSALLLVSGLRLAIVAEVALAQTDQVGLRILLVDTPEEAISLRERALAGERFEELAAAYSTDVTGPAGGFLGIVNPSDLSGIYQTLLEGLAPGDVSLIAETPDGYLVIQRVSLPESRWIENTTRGLRALAEDRLDDAEAALGASLEEAEGFGPLDYHLHTSLTNLAGVYRLRGDFQSAEPLYQRALDAAESVLGGDHPDLTLSLDNLAQLYSDMGDYDAAGKFLGRSQEILVAAFGPNHPSVAAGMLKLARLRHLEGNASRAESLYNVALSIFEQALGPDDPVVADTLDELASVLGESGRNDEAAALTERATGIRSRLP